MAYTTIDDPSAYFQTKLYTGNDSSRAITFDGNTNMQPDWSWFKARSEAYNHAAFDSVRGVQKLIRPNQTTAEETHSTTLTAFSSNGFSLGGGDAFTNANSVTYASWHWKAGTSFSNSAGANNATIASTGSINTDAGFSIISWTGDGNNGAKIAHGLGATPAIVITKRRNDTGDFQIGGSLIDTVRGGANSLLLLNTTVAMDNNSEVYQTFSSTTFQVGVNASLNQSGGTLISYCFKDVKGYSKFGSYTGNGNADGTFVYTGFKPAWVMMKRTNSTGNWFLHDNKRPGFNDSQNVLMADLANAEDTGYNLDLLSNGFKLRNVGATQNGSGSSFIYMAFAEQPLVTSTGVPATAR